MKITIDIKEQNVEELVEQMVAEQAFSEHYNQISSNFRNGVYLGTDKAVQKYIYSVKDKIIERVVTRATTEIIKKGLPKMLERLGNIDG
ncbi:MAG: hypothetical protein RR444_05050 [Oscillospiraceae bacterium]